MAAAIRAIAFDAYGTIFDVHSIGALADRFFPGRGVELSAMWRIKQIDYTRLRTIADRHEPFSQVTRDALTYTMRAMALPVDDAQIEALIGEYDRLAVFPDAADALVALKALGLPLAILSNGDPPMLQAIVANGGLDGVFDHLLSVDSVGRFKPSPDVYALGPQAFGCDVNDILFVSSNGWDACGAAWYGYRAFWINRAGMPHEELGADLAGSGRTMRDVMAFVMDR